MAKLFFVGIAMLCAIGAIAQSATTPKPGSADRKGILDALRPGLEKRLHQKIVFKVKTMRVLKGFAYVYLQPLQTNGKEIDYRNTQYWEDIQAGAFDDGVLGLLKKSGGKWKVLEWTHGATDWPVEEWIQKHGAPRNIAKT